MCRLPPLTLLRMTHCSMTALAASVTFFRACPSDLAHSIVYWTGPQGASCVVYISSATLPIYLPLPPPSLPTSLSLPPPTPSKPPPLSLTPLLFLPTPPPSPTQSPQPPSPRASRLHVVMLTEQPSGRWAGIRCCGVCRLCNVLGTLA